MTFGWLPLCHFSQSTPQPSSQVWQGFDCHQKQRIQYWDFEAPDQHWNPETHDQMDRVVGLGQAQGQQVE